MALQRVPDQHVLLCSLVRIKYFKAHYKVKKFVNFSRNLSFQCLWCFDFLWRVVGQDKTAPWVISFIGVGRFRILGGGGARFRYWGGGGARGAKFLAGT